MDDVADDYEVLDFRWDTSHGHMVSMLRERPQRGIVIDVGCGSAPHADALSDAGFTYVGLDFNSNCVATLAERGFCADLVDLRDIDGLAATLDHAAEAGRAAGEHTDVVALLSLDVMEHLVDPHLVLHEMSVWMLEHSVPTFGLSVPNVTHRDLSLKLMSARWNLTGSGLLDATHLRFFTDSSLTSIMQRSGFNEVGRSDSLSPWSDQHWPAASPLLHTVTPIGRFLEDLRDRADCHGSTYQFVRIFEPVAVAPSSPTLEVEPPPAEREFRLAVVADTEMSHADAEAMAADLEAQSSGSWALTDVVDATAADFSHAAFVGGGQRLGPDWVQQFSACAGSWPGMLLRCAPDPQLASGAVAHSWPERFDLFEHLDGAATPGAAFAVPMDAIDALGFDLGRSHAQLVAGIGRDLASYCGVHDTAEAAVAAVHDWRATQQSQASADVDRPAPILVEPSMLAGLVGGQGAGPGLVDRCRDLEAQLAEMAADNVWLNAELRVAPVRAVRRLLRRPGRRNVDAPLAAES